MNTAQQKQTHREQTSGYPWGDRWGVWQQSGRGLRSLHY